MIVAPDGKAVGNDVEAARDVALARLIDQVQRMLVAMNQFHARLSALENRPTITVEKRDA